MSRTKRFVILGLVLVLLFAAVTGIAYWTAGHNPSQREPGLYLSGSKVAQPGPAMWVGENEISFEDYRHYFLVLKTSFETWYGGDGMWADDPDGDKAYTLRKSVETDIVNMYAWLEIAKEQGIELSEEDRASISDTLAQQKEEYGAAFAQRLSDMFFADEAAYLRITELQKLAEKAQTEYGEAMKAEVEADGETAEKAEADYKAENISAKHILIAFDEENPDTAQAEADALAEAEELLAQIHESDDPAATFDELMPEHTDDAAGLEANPDGYTFKEGDMVTEFYEGALALDEYEISEPIKTTYGYHIILRLPLSESGLEAAVSSAVSAAAEAKKTEKLDAAKAAMPLRYSDYYDLMGPTDIV